MGKPLKITKAAFTRFWHFFWAKMKAAFGKTVSVSRFATWSTLLEFNSNGFLVNIGNGQSQWVRNWKKCNFTYYLIIFEQICSRSLIWVGFFLQHFFNLTHRVTDIFFFFFFARLFQSSFMAQHYPQGQHLSSEYYG